MRPSLPVPTSAAGWAHLLALLAGALALFNVPPDLTDPVRTAVLAAAGLVSAVSVHEHHATVRSTNAAAAQVSAAHADQRMAQMADGLSGMLSSLTPAEGGRGPTAAPIPAPGPAVGPTSG